MSGINTEQGDGLNIELNLVPFIDLLSSLTLFLLISAVWIQVAAIPTKTESQGRKVASQVVIPEKRLSVHITRGGYRLTYEGEAQNVGITKANLQTAAQRMLKRQIKQAAVTADGSVEYGLVVRTVDALKETGFERVALSAN